MKRPVTHPVGSDRRLQLRMRRRSIFCFPCPCLPWSFFRSLPSRLKASFWTSKAVTFCHLQRTSSLRCLSLSPTSVLSDSFFSESLRVLYAFLFVRRQGLYFFHEVMSDKVPKTRSCSLPVRILEHKSRSGTTPQCMQ